MFDAIKAVERDTFGDAVWAADEQFNREILMRAMSQLFDEDIGNEVNGAILFFQVAHASHVDVSDCERLFRAVCEAHSPQLRMPVEELVGKAREWTYDY